MFPGRIGKKGQRPEVGYVLLALHAQSEMVFGAEILGVTESIEKMLGRIPGWILSRLADHGMRPKGNPCPVSSSVRCSPASIQRIGHQNRPQAHPQKTSGRKTGNARFLRKRPSSVSGMGLNGTPISRDERRGRYAEGDCRSKNLWCLASDSYSIASAAVNEFITWGNMPWEG